MGTSDGSIIATIITSHMPRKDAALVSHVCPGIGIHIIDIFQPPGIGMSMDDIDAAQPIVSAALVAKSSAAAPKKARLGTLAEAMWITTLLPMPAQPFGYRS
jgi:hypothetical protein